MHFVLGALVSVATIAFAMLYRATLFQGFVNVPSLVLLLGLPVGVTLMTYRFAALGRAFAALWRTLGGHPERDRDEILGKLMAFGREVRRDRGAAASALLEGSHDSVLRHVGRHVLERSDAEEIEADAAMVGRAEIETYVCGERVFSTLGSLAPAVGMLGTVIGLIRLLSHMSQFDQLGPAMALALLTTFYGLILGYVVYLPLARLIADHGAQRAATMNLVVDGMLKLARRRPLHEVEAVVIGHTASAATTAEPVAE